MDLEVKVNQDFYPILRKSDLHTDQSIILEGPCQVRLRGKSYKYTNSSYFWIQKDIFYNINPLSKEEPSKKFATVIPENAAGNVSIILEQSTDLINWTPVNPGSFPPATSKRFFRVRSEEE